MFGGPLARVAVVVAILVGAATFALQMAAAAAHRAASAGFRRTVQRAADVVMRLDALVTRVDALAASSEALHRGVEQLAGEFNQHAEASAARARSLNDQLARVRNHGAALASRSQSASNELVVTTQRLQTRVDDLGVEQRDISTALRGQMNTVERLESMIREAVAAAREEIESVRRELIGPVDYRMIPAHTASSPRISIAVPVFNRPRQLRECLQSIVREVEEVGTDELELWVTDDASTDSTPSVAIEFAQKHAWIGFRANEANQGLEANLMEAMRPCTGEFVWLMGSDDLLAAGKLGLVLEATQTDSHDVLVFSKLRVDRSAARTVPDANAHVPLGVAEGESADYDNPLAVARLSGIVSAFGFTSQVLWRRTVLETCDPTPYIGLMMYPHLGLLLEAFATSRVLFHNDRVVLQRTLTAEQKLAESIGRTEESFMAGGEERDRRWFGAGYAALLQRAVDRSVIETAEYRELPERLFSEDSMLDFISRNWRAAVAAGVLHDAAVVADAVRLFESLELPIPEGANELSAAPPR